MTFVLGVEWKWREESESGGHAARPSVAASCMTESARQEPCQIAGIGSMIEIVAHR
jgi:hypothetical protein